ncbi:hypothetical protein FGO68_gene244 [Halteria grandinella]|uniref:Uncharacterized protein n=1 Tax=Halteria grandinella TaxID=5974 RepID=A0A8J8T2W1_HALGN|nr:hypothetical protein FGO68_gene244 [Halteria grandinella]
MQQVESIRVQGQYNRQHDNCLNIDSQAHKNCPNAQQQDNQNFKFLFNPHQLDAHQNADRQQMQPISKKQSGIPEQLHQVITQNQNSINIVQNNLPIQPSQISNKEQQEQFRTSMKKTLKNSLFLNNQAKILHTTEPLSPNFSRNDQYMCLIVPQNAFNKHNSRQDYDSKQGHQKQLRVQSQRNTPTFPMLQNAENGLKFNDLKEPQQLINNNPSQTFQSRCLSNASQKRISKSIVKHNQQQIKQYINPKNDYHDNINRNIYEMEGDLLDNEIEEFTHARLPVNSKKITAASQLIQLKR